MEPIGSMLDAQYDELIAPLLGSVNLTLSSGIALKSLNDLIDRAQDLEDTGRTLMPDDPSVSMLRLNLAKPLRSVTSSASSVSSKLVESASKLATEVGFRLATRGMSEDDIGVIRLVWNKPSEQALFRVADFTLNPAWSREIGSFETLISDMVRNKAIEGVTKGWNPLKTANEIKSIVSSTPGHRLNNAMRTLQMQSYRSADALQIKENERILDGHIRIAALDTRTCMSCIALHGERLAVGERVNDHHQGRCTSIAIIKGRDPRNIKPGREWFASLPESKQLEIAGPGKLEGLRTGRFTWEDFPKRYDNKVFGEMITEASIKDIEARRGL